MGLGNLISSVMFPPQDQWCPALATLLSLGNVLNILIYSLNQMNEFRISEGGVQTSVFSQSSPGAFWGTVKLRTTTLDNVLSLA